MTHHITIKIEFDKWSDQEEQQFREELEKKFRHNLQDFMNQLESGNGKIYKFLITKTKQ
jgi:hypothetical protein